MLYVNGEVDPWHANSINQDISKDLPALWVLGASHHAWTHPSAEIDQDSVVNVRTRIVETVKSWLGLGTKATETNISRFM